MTCQRWWRTERYNGQGRGQTGDWEDDKDQTDDTTCRAHTITEQGDAFPFNVKYYREKGD